MFLSNTEIFSMNLNSFASGSIQFIPEQGGREETAQTSQHPAATVTIINKAIAPVPAHFNVTFFIDWSRTEHGIEISNRMGIHIPIPAEDSDAPYLQIENAAAHRIPEELRALADLIQADLDRADARRAERNQGSE